MTAVRHYAHLTEGSVTPHRAALFPVLRSKNAADQAITAATEADITSLSGLDLPVLTNVDGRVFEVDFTIQLAETSAAANLVTIRIYNGANGTKADTLVWATGAVVSASSLGWQLTCSGFYFTPGTPTRTKIGLAVISSGNCTVVGTSNIISCLTVREVPA